MALMIERVASFGACFYLLFALGLRLHRCLRMVRLFICSWHLGSTAREE